MVLWAEMPLNVTQAMKLFVQLHLESWWMCMRNKAPRKLHLLLSRKHLIDYGFYLHIINCCIIYVLRVVFCLCFKGSLLAHAIKAHMWMLHMHLNRHSSQREVHSINLYLYNILIVHSNCAQRLLINNNLYQKACYVGFRVMPSWGTEPVM